MFIANAIENKTDSGLASIRKGRGADAAAGRAVIARRPEADAAIQKKVLDCFAPLAKTGALARRD